MILILGGAGYIGSHTLKHMMEHGYECVVVDNLSYGHKEAVQCKNFEIADLMDKSSLQAVFKKYKIDAVIHFAAFTYVGESVTDPKKYYENNVIGTLNLLSVMLEFNVKKIVFSSTCATYGNPLYVPLDEKHSNNPISPYGKTKLMIEQVLEDYKHAYNLQYIALRYFNAAGASAGGDIGESHNPETHLIPLVLRAIKGDIKNVSIFGNNYETPDGTCLRDYIHVDDLASAHRLAYEKLDAFSGNLNLGTGIATSVKEIIETSEKVSGKACPQEQVGRREGDPAVLYASNIKAKEVLGWEPKITKLEDIIASAWGWEQNKKF